MTSWSKEQDDVLMEHGHEGAERCAAIIGHRFGVHRTADAVKRHAYRVGISIVRYEVCPRCGRKCRGLSDTGVCPTCHMRELADDQKRFNRRLLDEIGAAERTQEYDEARREYQAARQQTSRLCRKHGLRNKKERRSGENV